MALWEVPLCILPPDKSSFPRERGAELERKSKGRVGPQEAEGTQFPSSETSVRECGCLFVCMYVQHMCTENTKSLQREYGKFNLKDS